MVDQQAGPGSSGRTTADFDAFVQRERPRLEAVLVAHYGVEVGPEAAADALAWAWEHWERVAGMDHPVGYLYRVAQSSSRRHLRWRRPVVLPEVTPERAADIDPGLPAALVRLSRQQRVAVVLVHAYGWTYEEAATAMHVSVSTLRNHLSRGTARLRKMLGETDDRS